MQFVNNVGSSGGGAASLSVGGGRGSNTSVSFTRCLFSGNVDTGFYGGGAVRYAFAGSSSVGSSLSFINCSLLNNTASTGGAMYLQLNGAGGLDALLRSCVLQNNTAYSGPCVCWCASFL